MIDLIGTKNAIAEGTAEKYLRDFHSYLKGWSTTPTVDGGRLLVRQRDSRGQPGATTDVSVRVVAFSDTALLRGESEYVLEDFYTVVAALQKHLEARGTPVFALVCCDEEIYAATTGGLQSGADPQHSYVSAIGTGALWRRLFAAFSALESKEFSAWHSKYRLYAVGDDAIGAATVIETNELAGGEKIAAVAPRVTAPKR